jgi:hypothetical protein
MERRPFSPDFFFPQKFAVMARYDSLWCRLVPSIPCPDSDRCDTTGVPVPPQRRSSPDISRFCPTLGWLHLVKNVTHRVNVHVALPVPIVLNVPDMWIRDEDNILLQTIANTISLNDYTPKWDYFWDLVAEEIPDLLTEQCRERYMSLLC